MEQRVVRLTKILPQIELQNYRTISISNNLKYLSILSTNGTASIYFISRSSDRVFYHIPIWKSTVKVHSCIFSEDEKQFMIITESNRLEIYLLNDDIIEILAERSTDDMSVLLEKYGIDFSDACKVIPQVFNRKHVMFIINNTWIISFNIFLSEAPVVTNKIELASCVKVVTCRNNIYSLTMGGNISAYSLEDGKPLGVVNLYSLLPRGLTPGVEVFSNIAVSADGVMVAVADQSNQVYVANIYCYFQSTDQQEEGWDCGMSVVSLNSGTSHISTRTTSSLLQVQQVGGDNVSLNSYKLPERDKTPTTYRSNWNSYLKSLKQKTSYSILDDAGQKPDSVAKAEELGRYLTRIADPPEGLVVRSLHIGSAGMSVWYTESVQITGGMYKLYSLASGTCIAQMTVPIEAAVITGGLLGLMDAFISPTNVWLFLGNQSRDVLVNKLLQCVQTESIGQLLQGEEWGDLVVPLPALADGLRQQQVDVARLALGLHAQAFKSAFTKNPSEDEDACWQMKIDSISMNMDKLFNTIHNAIEENVHKITFHDHLVLLSLDHANDLLRFLHDSGHSMYPYATPLNAPVEETVNAVVKRVMYHVVELRRHLHKSFRTKDATNSSAFNQPLEQLSEGLRTVWELWQTLEDDYVVRDAVSNNNIPLAQLFLLNCRGWRPESFSKCFRHKVNVWLEQLLSDKKIEETIKMLINTGCEPYEELRNMCMKSLDLLLRNNLAQYLSDQGLLKPNELDAWAFLMEMENILEAIELPNPCIFSHQIVAMHYCDVPTYEMPVDAECSSRLSIATIVQQDEEWKDMVLTDLFFNIPGSMLERKIKVEVAWKYLLNHNREDLLIAWINCYFHKDRAKVSHTNCQDIQAWVESMEAVKLNVGANKTTILTLEDMLTIFSSWSINENMIDCVHFANTMQRTKEMVLDHLSRLGIFSIREKKKASSILQRLVRTKSLHKLEEILNQSTSNVTCKEFQFLLTALIIKLELYDVPFSCLQDYEYSEDEIQALCSSSTEKSKKLHWFQLWLAFRQLGKIPSDEGLLYEAVLKSAQYLGGANIQTYLQEHPFVAVALIIFSGQPISNVFLTGACAGSYLDKDTLQITLQQLPILDIALSSLHNLRIEKPDVSVYQLLHGYTWFDTTKLFGWQEMNLIKGEEFPHFSSPQLIAKYGSKHTLTYLHYLKQGRPSFAVNKFIVDQFKAHGKLSKKSINQACSCAHGLALQNIGDSNITCGCIAFIEMLGHNSEMVRVHTAAASKILTYLSSKTLDTDDTMAHNREHVASLLYGLVQGKVQAAVEILLLLEDALRHEFSTLSNAEDSSREIVISQLHWNLAVKFAVAHKLKLPEMFLRQCAIEDKWLEFILFIELHSYPVEQVMKLVKIFHSAVLREHLTHALGRSISKKPEKGEAKLTLRDSRKLLYSKIGLKKGEASNEFSSDAQSMSAETSSVLTTSSSEDSSFSLQSPLIGDDVVSISPSNDIFLVLLRCHSSLDPSRALLTACQELKNPVLAVLATCYEPSSVLSCFCVWLLTCLSEPIVTHLTVKLAQPLQSYIWSSQYVEMLLEEAVSSTHITSLYRAFKLFLLENPLCAFAEFLFECVVKKNFKSSIINVKLFKASFLNLKLSTIMFEENNVEGTFLDNGHWVASIAIRLAVVALARCFSSAFHQLQFVNTLLESSFTNHLPVSAPDLALLAKLLETLSGTGVHLDLEVLCLGTGGQEFEFEIQRCLEQLILRKHFQQALQLAELVKLPKDAILVAQWCNNFEQLQQDSNSFWGRCNDAFRDAKINPLIASGFFKDHAEKVENYKERYHVLNLAVTWYQQVEEGQSDELEVIQRHMWSSWLQAETELQVAPHGSVLSTPILLCSLKAEILKSSGLSSLGPATALSSEKEEARLDLLIGKLLDQGDVVTACRVEAMFNQKNQDLQILLTCMGLAEGELTPYQLSTEQRLLLSESRGTTTSSYRRRTLLSSVSSKSLNVAPDIHLRLPGKAAHSEVSHSPLNYSISSDYIEIPSRDRQDTLSVLEKLSERMTHGRKLSSRVLMCYRVAMNLDKSYQEIIALEDPLFLLKTAIADDCLNKFIVASDLMSAAQISGEEVAEFLCGEIVMAISRHNPQGDVGTSYMWGCELGANFHLVLEICDDPSMLGTKLLAVASHLGSTHPEALHEVHVVVVELIVCAHDCFTAACNMEGIAAVLHKARTLTASLQNRQEWALMVRLLTGVGRYVEMSYIFQILRENDQFEFLLGKGLDMVSGLKLAVLDFLKLHCPDDRKLFQMVAIHFAMFGEMALLWDSGAKSGIDSLLAVTRLESSTDAPVLLNNTEDTKQCLNDIMESFRNATEYFLKANKLTRAMASAHQAELVALQILVISSVPAGQGADSLLRLNAQQVASVIANKLSFPQACIVARAYCHPVDWGMALYQHCIVNREASYLADFTHNMSLTTALVEDVARRFQLDTNVNLEMAQEMKKFVQCVMSVEVKYRVASQLGFRDIIESLLNGPDVAILKDTVWRRGFSRNQF